MYTNTTLDSILAQDLGLPITDSDSALLNHSQNAATHDDEQIEEEDNNNDGIDKNDGVDYGSSNNKNEDDENEIDLSIEELNDRILELVTDQLRESGIDFPP